MSKLKKTVDVRFLGDDDVVQHITYAEEKRARRQQHRKNLEYAKSTGSKKKSGRDIVEDSSGDDESTPVAFNALQVGEEHVSGSDVFQFRTPKRAQHMAQKASEARKLGSSVSSPATPISQTPGKGSSKRKPASRPEATTPYRLRKRNEKAMADDSSSDGSLESEDADSDDDDVPAKTPDLPPKSKSATPRNRGRERTTVTQAAEQYFDLHADPGRTSDRTLAKLDMPQLDRSKLDQLLAGVTPDHLPQRKELKTDLRQAFPQWMIGMLNGFNVLLHGLGSKSSLLEEFRQTCLKDFSHISVNGYFPSLTLRQILNLICEDILEHTGSFKSPLHQFEFIRRNFEQSAHRDMFLVIHNIDGPMLRGEKTQNMLSLLAQIHGIHIIASVDHINAPLIWDLTKCCRFNWAWQDATTFESYRAEISYENSLMIQQSGAMALNALIHVMNSLTPNARGIFLLLMRHQLDNKDSPIYAGLSFQELYQRCREVFLVNSDLTLRAQLIEFTDHKLIRARKNLDGVEQLWIPISAGTLAEFLEQQEGEGH